MRKICGIYSITNNINGKAYIGQSKDIITRWKQHCSRAKNGDVDYLIVLALRKYGVENFTFAIIEECRPSELNTREMYYIELFNTYIGKDGGYGYNMTVGGEGKSGGTIKVDQYDKEGNFMRAYDSITSAADICGVHKTQITQCCKLNPKYRSAGGYQWRYHGDEPPEKYSYRDVSGVVAISVDGEILHTYSSCEEAAINNDVTRGYMYDCCRSTVPTLHGYIWCLTGK